MQNDLTIGTDYASIAGYAGTGNQMIYLGNDTFRLIKANGETKELSSKAQADKFRAYINQPTVFMGRL